MPISYTIDPAARVATVAVTGEVAREAWTEAIRAMFADPAYAPGFGVLVDRRRAAVPSADFVRHVVRFLSRYHREMAGARVAMLVGEAAGYGMARMLQILADQLPFELEVFTDPDEARRFVGLAR